MDLEQGSINLVHHHLRSLHPKLNYYILYSLIYVRIDLNSVYSMRYSLNFYYNYLYAGVNSRCFLQYQQAIHCPIFIIYYLVAKFLNC